MNIVMAPDSYKECLTALQVAISIESGFREVFPNAVYIKVPVADGGEGTVEAMIEATSGRRVDTTVRGPLGDPVEAFYGLTGDGSTAVIEMAAASGLALVPPAHGAVQVRHGLVVFQGDALFLALGLPLGEWDGVGQGEACGFGGNSHGV